MCVVCVCVCARACVCVCVSVCVRVCMSSSFNALPQHPYMTAAGTRGQRRIQYACADTCQHTEQNSWARSGSGGRNDLYRQPSFSKIIGPVLWRVQEVLQLCLVLCCMLVIDMECRPVVEAHRHDAVVLEAQARCHVNLRDEAVRDGARSVPRCGRQRQYAPDTLRE